MGLAGLMLAEQVYPRTLISEVEFNEQHCYAVISPTGLRHLVSHQLSDVTSASHRPVFCKGKSSEGDSTGWKSFHQVHKGRETQGASKSNIKKGLQE